MNAAAADGLVVGRDLAVTGYDDTAVAQFLHPPLTSVRQPIAAVAREIVRLLLGELRHEPAEQRGILLNPELIVRQSSNHSISQSLNL